jgi:histidinol-phosphate aminotransferase
MRIRDQIKAFKPYSPGLSMAQIKQDYNLSRVIKLASNENPLGTSPMVIKALEESAPFAHRYPRPGSPDLAAALADVHGLEKERFVIGNGSDEIIDLLIRAVPRPESDNIVLCEPSFSIYRLQATLCSVTQRFVPLNQDFSVPWTRLLDTVDGQTALIFLTSPDNPTGQAPGSGEILNFIADLPRDCTVVLDEAYIHFADHPHHHSPLASLPDVPNLVILRTFSKMFGLAALRLGYGIMAPELADMLLRIKLPFSVNLLAEQAGLAALRDEQFVRETLRTVRQGRRELFRGLAGLDCTVTPSQANFLMFAPPRNAAEVHQALLQKGVIVRPLGSYGLSDHLRVSVGTQAENRLFLQALQEVLEARV